MSVDVNISNTVVSVEVTGGLTTPVQISVPVPPNATVTESSYPGPQGPPGPPGVITDVDCGTF